MNIKCKYCNSIDIVKRGLRKLKKGKKQVFSCKNCDKRFTLDVSKKKFDVKIILNAVNAYNQGYSLDEVCDLILRRHKVVVGRSSVLRWCKEFGLGYLDIKDRLIGKYGSNLIIGRVFKHSGLLYNFKFHKGKLKEFGKFLGLKNFIFDLSKGVDGRIFNSENRCSKLKEKVSVNARVSENIKLNKVIGDALKIVRNNKQRHDVVENFLLNCDRDTVAVEVPIWYWDKIQDRSICGHIDILQVKNGKVWVLDYKPNASSENVDKVVSQLYNYALGLSFRSKVDLKNIKCGWFDENKIFSFDADKVRFP